MRRLSDHVLRCGILFFCLFLMTDSFAQQKEYADQQIIVKFKNGFQANQAVNLKNRLNATTRNQFRSIGAELWQVVNWDVEEAIRQLKLDPGIEYAEPNYIVSLIEARESAFPDDPNFANLWGLNNTGQTGGTPDADIDAPEAWDLETGTNVVVGVIDTGVDWTHEDLADNIWQNPNEVGNNGIDDDGNGFIDDVRGWDFVNNDNNPFDDDGHGTHVSGTIAAVGNNGIGVVGVNWSARIMPLKFLDANGFGTTSDAILAIEYASMMGATITNNSWGGTEFSLALRDAIAAAGESGMLFMAAAGNGGGDGFGDDNDIFPHFPSNYDLDNIIAVAATDDNDLRAVFSNFGEASVDLGAPGVGILSTLPGNGYGFFSGTSMATPHVSGLASLIWSQVPGLGHLEVKNLIMSTVDSVAALIGATVTGGRINAFKALTLANPDSIPPTPVTDLQAITPTSNSITLTWTATGDDSVSGQAAQYDIRYSESPIDTSNFDTAEQAQGEPQPQEAGNRETFTVVGLDFNTTYHLALEVIDEHGNRSGLSNLVFETTLGIPAIAVSPESLSDSLLTGEMATHTVTLSNTAEGTLDFVFPDFANSVSLRVTHSDGDRLGLQILNSTFPENQPTLQNYARASGRNYELPRGRGSSYPLLDRLLARTTAQTIFFDDMENGINGWSTRVFQDGVDDLWHQTRIGFNSDSTSWWSGIEAQGNYDTGRRINNAVISPAIDLSRAAEPITLSFFENYITERGFDYVMVDVSADGGASWIPLRGTAESGSAPSGSSGGWVMTILDLSRFAGEAIRIRFYFDTLDGGANDFPGWFFDDVLVSSAGVSWLSVNPAQGRIFAGENQDVDVQFDATGLLAGEYETSLSIISNDPVNPEVPMAVSLSVSPAPDIAVSPGSLDFGTVFVGFEQTRTLAIANIGSDSLSVDSLVIDHPDFSLQENAFHLAPGERKPITVTFSASMPEQASATLTVTSNDPFDPITTVDLRGTGVLPPDISITPSSLSEDLLTGQKSTQALTIRNEGQQSTSLDFEIAIQGLTGVAGEALVSFRKSGATNSDRSPDNQNHKASLAKKSWSEYAQLARQRTPGSLKSATKRTEEEVALPVVIQDPSGDGGLADLTILRGASTQDELQISMEFSTAIDLFDFGGYLSLDIDQNASTGVPPTFGIPSQDIGAEFEFILFGVGNGFVDLIDAVTGAFVDSYPVETTSTTISFSAPLSALNADDGFMDVTGVVGNFSGPTDWFPDIGHGSIGGVAWLSATPLSGSIPGGTEMEIEVAFDAAGLFGGAYNADILVSSNDPDESTVPVGVQLRVTNAPDIFVGVDTLDFRDVFVGATDTLELVVENRGTADLIVISAGVAPAEFGISPAVAGMDPGEQDIFTVTFSPSSPTAFQGLITLVSNDADQDTTEVFVLGSGLLPPAISIAPESFSESLVSGEMSSHTLTIENSSELGSDLIFEIKAAETSGGTSAEQKQQLQQLAQQAVQDIDWRPESASDGNLSQPDFPLARFNSQAQDYREFVTQLNKKAQLSAIGIAGANSTPMFFNLLTSPGLVTSFTFTDLGDNYNLQVIQAFDGIIVDESDASIFATEAQALGGYSGLGKPILLGMDDFDEVGANVQNQLFPVFGISGVFDATFTFGSLNPENPITQGVSTLAGFGSDNDFYDTNGAEWIFADVAGNFFGVSYDARARTVLIGESLAAVWFGGLDNPLLLENAIRWMMESGVPWLSVEPDTGTVAAGNSMDITLTFDASGLEGEFGADLLVTSNDPFRSIIPVPVTLSVAGAPRISVRHDTLDFGQVFIGTTDSLFQIIENVGSRDLIVLNTSAEPSEYSVTPAQLSVDPGETDQLLITFSPEAVGDFSGALAIVSNDPITDTLRVVLQGQGVEPPSMAVTPDSLNQTLNSGEISTQIVTIRNDRAGSGDLVFDISIDNVTASTSFPQQDRISRDDNKRARAAAPRLAKPATGQGAIHVDSRSQGFNPYQNGPDRSPGSEAIIAPYAGDLSLAANGALFAIDLFSGLVVELDPLTGQALKSFQLPEFASGPEGLAFDGAFLYYIAGFASNTIFQIDIANGAVVNSVTIGGLESIDGLGHSGEALYASGFDTNTIYKIDFENSAIIDRFTFDFEIGGGLTFAGRRGTLFVADFFSQVYEIDPETWQVINSFSPPNFEAILGLGYSQGLEVLFLSGVDSQTLYAVDPNDGSISFSFPLSYASAIAADEAGDLFLAVNPASGVVPADSSINIEVTFDASKLNGGDYTADLVIASNDPEQLKVTVPAHLQVVGVPEIAVSADSINFGSVFIGGSEARTLKISNIGTDELNVENISADNSNFTVDVTSFSLAPNEVQDVIVAFAPEPTGEVFGTLTVTSNDSSRPAVSIALLGEGVEPPVINIVPDSLFDALVTGGTSRQTLIIDNSEGASDLIFEIEIDEISTPAQSTLLSTGVHPFADFKRNGTGHRPPPQLLIHGSHDPAGRTLDTGDILDVFTLPFEGWTGLAWDGAHLWANNFQTVGLFEIDPANGAILAEIPVPAQLVGLVYDGTHFWAGAWPSSVIMKIDRSGNVVATITAPTDFIGGIAWDGEFLWVAGPAGNKLYQISTTGVLNRTVDLASLNPSSGYWSAVWVEDHEDGELWVCNEFDFSINQLDVSGPSAILRNKFAFPGEFPYSLTHDGKDLWYADWNPFLFKMDDGIQESLGWITVEPTMGTVPAGSSQEVDVMFDAAGLIDGPYDARIIITSNDPLNSEVQIPCHLDVSGAAQIAVSDSSLDFGVVFIGLSAERSLQVANEGTEDLTVTGISADNPEFFADVSDFILQPGENRNITMTFAPADTGMRIGVLTISSNDPDMSTITVDLAGVGLIPPRIAVEPSSMSFFIQPGDSVTELLKIANTGGSPLNFSIRDEEEESNTFVDDQILYSGFNRTTTPDTLFRSDPDGVGFTAHSTGNGQLRGILVDNVHERVYWTDGELGRIYSSNLGGTDAQQIVSQANNIVDIAVDSEEGKIYWTDFSSNAIFRANLNGSDREIIIQGISSHSQEGAPGPADAAPKEAAASPKGITPAQLFNPWGIALDQINRKLYWTEQNGDRIQRANPDGSEVETIIEFDLAGPRGIGLDPQEGKIYFVDSFNLMIKRANLDGSDVETLIVLPSESNPLALELDLQSRRIYWTDNFVDRIQRANFNGAGIETIAEKTAVDNDGFFGIGLFSGSGWLTQRPTSGIILPDSDQEIRITANSKDLATGKYFAAIIVESNDFTKNVVSIPVELTVNVSGIELAIPDTLQGIAGGTLEAPIFLSISSDSIAVSALGAALKLSNTLLTFNGFTAGAIVPGPQFDINAATADSLLIAFADFGNGPIVESGLLATLLFQVSPDVTDGQMVSLHFENGSASGPTGESISLLAIDGKATFSEFVSISGGVTYCSPDSGGDSNKPVGGLAVSLIQGGVTLHETLSDSKGDFEFRQVAPGSAYVLSMAHQSRETDLPVNPTDAFLVVQHFLGNFDLNGCQKLASDVDGDDDINPTDALLIFNRFLGIVTEFVVEDWRAFPASYEIDANDNWKSAPDSIESVGLFTNQRDQDFYAAVSGDVNLDWSSNLALAKSSGASNYNSQAPLQIRFADVDFSPYARETTFSVVLDGTDLKQGVRAFGFELQYDAEILEVKSVESSTIEGFRLGFNEISNVSAVRQPAVTSENTGLRFGGFSTSSSTISESIVLFKVTAQLKSAVGNEMFLPIRLSHASAVVRSDESAAATEKDFAPAFVEMPIALAEDGLELTSIPNDFALEANYPNPFNPSTKIRYRLPEAASVRLQIFNVSGQRIKTLIDEQSQSAGFYEVDWHGLNEQGAPVASGVYFYRIEAHSASHDYTKILKMTLLK